MTYAGHRHSVAPNVPAARHRPQIQTRYKIHLGRWHNQRPGWREDGASERRPMLLLQSGARIPDLSISGDGSILLPLPGANWDHLPYRQMPCPLLQATFQFRICRQVFGRSSLIVPSVFSSHPTPGAVTCDCCCDCCGVYSTVFKGPKTLTLLLTLATSTIITLHLY